MATIHWASGVSGDYSDGADWIGGKAPTAADDAVINASGTYTVTISSADAADLLTVDDADATVAINFGGALTLGSALTATAGTIDLNGGGTISGGVLSATGGAFDWHGGVLDGVKYEGTLDLSPAGSLISITSQGLVATGAGGAGDGTINLTGDAAALILEGTQTLDKATVDLGSSGSASLEQQDTSGPAVLTLGAGLTIDHAGTLAGIADSGSVDGTVVNKGVINADFSGGQFTINPFGFTNDGKIAVSGGDTLVIQSTDFDNAGGTLTVAAGSTFDLVTSVTTAQLAGVANRGAMVIERTITNTGATLSVGPGAALGTLTLSDIGEVEGGTIKDAGSGMLFDNGTFDGVTYDGTLDMSPTESILDVTSKGLVVTGVSGTGNGTIDISGSLSTLNLEGTQTFDKATVDLGSSGDDANIAEDDFSAPATLTLGAGLTIDHTGPNAQITSSNFAGDAVVNKGVVNADLSGGQFLINPLTFVNDGVIAISEGDTLTFGGKFASSITGTLTVGSASSLDIGNQAELELQGHFVNAGTVTLQGDTLLLVESGGLSLTGGGTVVLEDLGADIYGVSAGTKLTNVDNTISGFGYVGQNRLTLTNEAAGVIEASGGDLTVRTAGETMVNDGAMEAADHATLLIFDTTVDQAGGGTISALTGGRVDLEDADIIGGALVGTGQLVTNAVGGVLDGRASKVSLTGALVVLNATNLTIEGSIDNAGKIDLDDVTTATDLIVGTGGATLSGGGQVNLTNRTGNIIDGVSASTTLTNVDNRIAGGGLLGDDKLILVNEAAGVIDGNTAAGLVINTGTSTITNAGEIAAGLGTVTVSSAIDNTGKLFAAGGTIVLEGAVTGAGTGEISGGTLDAAGAFNENVTFNTASGVLELAHSQTYAGTISDFSKAGGTSLDLADITFTSGVTKASYSGTTASGVLTVTNGTQTAKIKLAGDYLTSKFTTSSDGHGGTTVVDPTSAASQPAAAARFVSAIATFAAPQAASVAGTADIWRTPSPDLVLPRPHLM